MGTVQSVTGAGGSMGTVARLLHMDEHMRMPCVRPHTWGHTCEHRELPFMGREEH